jgi:hypothetical protein
MSSRFSTVRWPGVMLMGAGLILLGGCIPQDGQTDPNQITPQPTTLLNQTYSILPAGVTFNPTAVGKQVTVSVASNVTASRIMLMVTDSGGSNVVNVLLPTSNTSSGAFISTSTGSHLITAVEIAAVGPATYTMTAIQSP